MKPIRAHFNEHDGRTEYLFSVKTLREIMGGRTNELKQELHDEGLISTASVKQREHMLIGE